MIKPIRFTTDDVRATLDGRKTVTRRPVNYKHLRGLENLTAKKIQRACIAPYQIGDILWVQETWAKCQNAESYVYKADFDGYAADTFLPLMKWQPSNHMPREAARIWLRVTDVRVERLQEIDGAGVYAEGTNGSFGATRGAFIDLWDSTIKPADRDRYGWSANPWVRVIDFERCEKPAD